jgi:hypothetical protein
MMPAAVLLAGWGFSFVSLNYTKLLELVQQPFEQLRDSGLEVQLSRPYTHSDPAYYEDGPPVVVVGKQAALWAGQHTSNETTSGHNSELHEIGCLVPCICRLKACGFVMLHLATQCDAGRPST